MQKICWVTKNKMHEKIQKYIQTIYIPVLIATVIIGLFDAFFYPGFFVKHFLISPIFVYVFFIIISYINSICLKKKKDFKKTVFNIKTICLLVFCVLYFLLNILEGIIYSNFVFSKFHIHPDQLIYPFIILLIDLFFWIKTQDIKKQIKWIYLKLFKFKTIALILIVVIVFNNLLGILKEMKKDIVFVFNNPFASTDSKYEYMLGKQFYNFTKFIKKNTPENSKILIPPFPAYPWPQTGNAMYLRYFLYPRKLVSGDEFEPNKDLLGNFDYVLIAWGETSTTSKSYTHGWPKFNIKAKKMIIMNSDNTNKTIFGDYIYDDLDNMELWGLIEIYK